MECNSNARLGIIFFIPNNPIRFAGLYKFFTGMKKKIMKERSSRVNAEQLQGS